MSLRAALHKVRSADEEISGEIPLTAKGLEAVIVGGFMGLERKDWVVPGLRERVGGVLRGCPISRLAKPGEGARPYRIAPVSSSPANRLLHACGLAMAGDVVLVFLGQGSASYGAFHESLNLAALHRLDIIFLVSCWDLDHPESPLARQVAGSLTAKALAYGLRGRTVDGGLVTEVLNAVTSARAEGGPHLIEARLARGDDPLARAYDELTETVPFEANAGPPDRPESA